jgi:surface carbohydrate biosynthesis protein
MSVTADPPARAYERGAARVPIRSTPLSRILYLPMEIASRELDSRLLLAAFALERGYEIVLGQKWLIERNVESMPPGIYLSKTLTQRDARTMARVRDRGFIVAAIDEEVPGLVAKPNELRWVSDEAIGIADFVFVGGDNNVSAYRQRFPTAAERIVPCLNPRWDLLKADARGIYAEEAARIRERYGRFVLINTNLGFTNSEKGDAKVMVEDQARSGKLDMSDPAVRHFVDEFLRMERDNFSAVKRLVQSILDDVPGVSIVLRPHPSERIDTWMNAFPANPRLAVVREGAPIPWILASEALVHTNCTTGVEAIALDHPALCMVASNSFVLGRYLANRVNPLAQGPDVALDMLKQHIAGTQRIGYTAEMRALFERSMSFDADRPGAMQIVEQLAAERDRRSQSTAAMPEDRSQWMPGRNYKWTIRDKNVRGTLFPNFSYDSVFQRLHQIASQARVSISPRIYFGGSKVALITERQVPLSLRMRQFIMKNVA